MTQPYYAGYTDSTDVVATYILNLLKAAASTLGADPDKSFWYGDHGQMFPTTPAIVVLPGQEQSAYNGIGGRPVLTTFSTYVMCYSTLLADVQLNVHTATQLTKLVKSTVHADYNLGGLVIDCMSSQVDPGISIRAGVLYDAARVTFRSRSKYALNPTLT